MESIISSVCPRHGQTDFYPVLIADAGGHKCLACHRENHPRCACTKMMVRRGSRFVCLDCAATKCAEHKGESRVGGCPKCAASSRALTGALNAIFDRGAWGIGLVLKWGGFFLLGLLAWCALSSFDAHAAEHGHPGFLMNLFVWALGAAGVFCLFLLLTKGRGPH